MGHIAVGMSGGVDSAVAAAILMEQGFEIEGFFMKNWDENSEFCTSERDYKDALQVCSILGIPLRTINFEKEYWNRVFKHFLDEYKKGRTPNPDILCNSEIKFKEFLDYTLQLGAEKIATGHYARSQLINGKLQLLKGIDDSKDQSYFLYGLNQDQIANSIFPIGEIDKSDVRMRAKQLGFNNYNKKDSVGICFIGERNIQNFLKNYIPKKYGYIVNTNGTKLGEHEGVMYYTIGQRKGLGIGGINGDSKGAWYVIGKDIINNELIVCQGHEHPALYHKKLNASNINWISGFAPNKKSLNAKIRYRSSDKPCSITQLDDDNLSVVFDEPCFAIAPGQSIVFYEKNMCLGGAIIDSYSN